MTRLQSAIAAARAAVTERSGAFPQKGKTFSTPDTTQIDEMSTYTGDLREKLYSPDKVHMKRLTRPQSATRRPQDIPPARVLATFQSAEVIAQGIKLSRGAVQVWSVLHRLAVDVARARGYRATPTQVTFHLPAVTLAGAVGYARSHLYRLLDELTCAGLLDGGGHAQNVMGRSLYDGCLWAVRTRLDAEPPRVRADEWKHQWRPGFTADVLGKTGAAEEMRQLQAFEDRTPELLYQAAKHRAAIPDAVSSPAESSCLISAPAGLRAVSEACGGIWSAHARHRARGVGQLASALCYALGEPERRRYWCRVIWEAWRDSVEGRTGLQGLAAQVSRLAADLEEGAPWRVPGAVLAARLKGASA